MSNSKTIKFSVKLPLTIVGLLFLMLIAATIGIIQFQSALDMFGNEVTTSWNRERDVNALNIAFREQVQEWKNVLLRGKNKEQREKYWKAFEKKEQDVSKIAKKLQDILPPSPAKESVMKFAEQHAIMGQKYRLGFEAFKAADFDHEKGDNSVKGIDREPVKLLAESSQMLEKVAASTSLVALEGARRAKIESVIGLITVSVLGLIVATVFCRSVLKLLGGEPDDAAAAVRAIATGDLSIQIKVNEGDESSLLCNLRNMQSSLVNIVSKIRTDTEKIANAASQIAAGNKDLSSRTEEQASSLEETAASMEELASTVNANNENEKEAKTVAQSASKVALQGGTVASRVMDTMKSINESSKRIVDIISVIDGIAFQTNILALNAAVEAARAGEEGRGFAVVASEVRSLAQRSATAAKEIKTLINDSVEKIATGSLLVNQAGATMDDVVKNVTILTDIMEHITTSKSEQACGISQVNQALIQLDDMTQRNAASVEEAEAAAQNMMDQSQHLLALVSIFKLEPESAHLTGIKSHYRAPAERATDKIQRIAA